MERKFAMRALEDGYWDYEKIIKIQNLTYGKKIWCCCKGDNKK